MRGNSGRIGAGVRQLRGILTIVLNPETDQRWSRADGVVCVGTFEFQYLERKEGKVFPTDRCE